MACWGHVQEWLASELTVMRLDELLSQAYIVHATLGNTCMLDHYCTEVGLRAG